MQDVKGDWTRRTSAGQFEEPAGVATDSSGDVYVPDWGNARIDEFSAAGAFIEAFGWGVNDGVNHFEVPANRRVLARRCGSRERCAASKCGAAAQPLPKQSPQRVVPARPPDRTGVPVSAKVGQSAALRATHSSRELRGRVLVLVQRRHVRLDKRDARFLWWVSHKGWRPRW